MTSKLTPKELQEVLKPEHVAPFVGYLAHENCTDNGQIYEIVGAKIQKIRLQKTKGMRFNIEEFTMENLAKNWDKITDWTDATHPTDALRDSLNPVLEMIMREREEKGL